MPQTVSFIVCLIFFTACKERPERIPDNRNNDYALYDEKGDFHRLSTYNDSKAIVLWVQGNGCPIVRNALRDFNEIVSEYSRKGVTFFMINSNLQDNREHIKDEASLFNFTIPVLDDSAQLIADELDITITAEAIVLHPITREILFRGPLNDRLDYEAQKNTASTAYLSRALDTILEGNKPLHKKEMVRGCKVTRLSKIDSQKALTYTRDIAPILQQHCLQCHHKEGIAPWAMTDYNTIVGWSSMIRQVLLSKRMPPWKADPAIGDFHDSFALPDSNARKIMRWIENGLSMGNGADPLLHFSPSQKIWARGMPDKIVRLAAEELPATGTISYRYQKIPLQLEEDTWLKGIEILPGNSKVLHHIVITNTERNSKSPVTERAMRPWTDNYIALGGGANQVTFYPDSTGVFLPKGTSLTVQLHYTTTGKKETDETQIGLYFYKEPPEKEFYALAPSLVDFIILPHEKKVLLEVKDTITRDIRIHYIVPHMHFRGKSIRFSVQYPDGKKEILVSVPDFNFNWQWLYKLKQPTYVPAGSVIVVEGVYDNSFQNPLNPDPSQKVTYGIQSTDEMLIGFFNYTLEGLE